MQRLIKLHTAVVHCNATCDDISAPRIKQCIEFDSFTLAYRCRRSMRIAKAIREYFIRALKFKNE